MLELNIPINYIEWKPCWRIISGRFPSIDIFGRVANPAEFQALYELEAMTNDRIRDEIGDINLVPKEDRIYGDGTSIIMSAFTHFNRSGSRFSNGTYGVFYTAKDLKTAIAETKYHKEIFMRATSESKMTLEMRVYTAILKGDLHDIRNMLKDIPEVYSKDSYNQSQSLGLSLKTDNSSGIIYNSIRCMDGECVAVLRPPVLSSCREEKYLHYIWDGEKIIDIYEAKSL